VNDNEPVVHLTRYLGPWGDDDKDGNVLAKWASEGASGLLELGPTMTRRLYAVCTDAEAAASDEARLAAYQQLRQMLSWLNHPLEHPDVYDL